MLLPKKSDEDCLSVEIGVSTSIGAGTAGAGPVDVAVVSVVEAGTDSAGAWPTLPESHTESSREKKTLTKCLKKVSILRQISEIFHEYFFEYFHILSSLKKPFQEL